MKEHYISYHSSLYEATTLKYWAKRYLAKLPPKVDGLLTRGRSGIAIASAMIALSKRPLHQISFAHSKEKSHSQDWQGWLGSVDPTAIYAIVDDFIDTGQTIKYLLQVANERNLTVVAVIVSHFSLKSVKVEMEVTLVEEKF